MTGVLPKAEIWTETDQHTGGTPRRRRQKDFPTGPVVRTHTSITEAWVLVRNWSHALLYGQKRMKEAGIGMVSTSQDTKGACKLIQKQGRAQTGLSHRRNCSTGEYGTAAAGPHWPTVWGVGPW